MKQTILLTALLLVFSSCRADSTTTQETEEPVKSTVVRVIKEKTILSPEVKLDRTHILAGTPQEIFLMAKFDIPEKESSEKRPDLFLSMVLDRSGSMSGAGKMGYAIDAACFGVDLLKSQDNISVVEYDDRINTLWPLSPVTSKEMVKEMIKTLSPRGGTNLCGGMDEGILQLEKDESGSLKRVLLISDGQANEGIVNPVQIAAHAKRAYERGITVSTMGVGLDYNEDLMQSIAEAGGGNYFFIEDPASIRELFAEEMGTLFHTVAQNIELSLNGSDLVESITVVGDTGTTKQLASLYGGEKRVVLFKVKTKAVPKGKESLGRFTVKYTIPESEKQETIAFDLPVTVTKDSVKLANSVIKPVQAEATLIEAEKIHEESVRLYEEGKKEEALRQIQAQNVQLKALNGDLNDKRISAKIQALEMENQEMEEADQSITQKKLYLKRSKERNYYAKKGQRGKFMVSSTSDKSSVVRLQKTLKTKGYYNGTVDGVYDVEVRSAVAEFQRDSSLEIDSIAGPMTLKKMGLY